jgi:sorting nexin-4
MLPKHEMSPLISVSNPLLFTDPFNTKVSYIIKTEDSSGVFECTRFFSEILKLRKVFTNKWPGVYIPPIPSKSFLSNFSPKFVKTYKKQVEFFLAYVAKHEFLYRSSELQKFLKSKEPFKAKVALDLAEVSVNYQAVFHEYTGRVLTGDMIEKLNYEEEFLKQSLMKIVELRDRAEVLSIDFREYHSLLSATNVLMGKMEHLYLFTQESPNVFIAPNLSNIKNPYSEIYFWAENEILDIEAMLESIGFAKKLEKDAEKLENLVQFYNSEIEKLEKKQMTVGRFFSFKSGDKYVENVVLKKADKESELVGLRNFLTIVSLRLIEKELPVFKEIRADVYANMSEKFNDITERTSQVMCESAKETLRSLKKIS